MTNTTPAALSDRGIHIVYAEGDRYPYSVEREWLGEFYEIAAVSTTEEARVVADAWIRAGNPGPHSWHEGSREADRAIEDALDSYREETRP